MNFINPIEILQLQNAFTAGDVDAGVIKRAKRKLFAEIELSDNELHNYNGNYISKSDCERAIEELDNQEKREFYHYLTTNQPLDLFLATGNNELFNYFTQDKIYKNLDFINFINPFFSERFDKILLKAFKDNDEKLLRSILQTQTLVNHANINTAFKSVDNEIKNRIAETNEITNEIKNKEIDCNEESIEQILAIVQSNFPIEIINSLPEYFQSQINKIASSINFLVVAIDNEFGISKSSIYLMEHLLKLNIESIGKKTFESNYEIIKKKHFTKIEEEKNAPTLKQWATSLIELKALHEKLKSNIAKPKDAENKIKSVNILLLNSLPTFADDIRNSFANVYSSISITIWNKHRNINSAISLIKRGMLINSSSEVKAKLLQDLNDLIEIKREKELAGKPINSAPSISTTHGIGTEIYGRTLYFVIFYVPILPIARYNCQEIFDGYRFFGKLRLHNWQKAWQWGLPIGIVLLAIIGIVKDRNDRNSYPSGYSISTLNTSNTSSTENTSSRYDENIPSTSYPDPTFINSKYKGNQLKNGVSPFFACFGKNLYAGNAKLTVKNGSASDAIICLYSISNDRTIRNSYIRANTNFTISSISKGFYMIRVFYGNDWNPTVTNDCGGKGNFESNISFSEFDNSEYFEDSEKGFTIATITLYTVVGGNASSSSIDKSKFFNK